MLILIRCQSFDIFLMKSQIERRNSNIRENCLLESADLIKNRPDFKDKILGKIILKIQYKNSLTTLAISDRIFLKYHIVLKLMKSHN